MTFTWAKVQPTPTCMVLLAFCSNRGSARGQVQESIHGLVQFPDTIRNQFTTSLTSLDATYHLRERLLNYQREFYQNSIQKAKQSDYAYHAFVARGDRSRLQRFADTLLRHDIQCFWLKKNLKRSGKTLPGRHTLIVPHQQPEFRFLQSLLERRQRFRENIFYDVSAWTLPLAYNLESTPIDQVPEELLQAAELGHVHARKLRFRENDYAYLVDWRDSAAAQTLADLMKHEIRVKVATEPFTIRMKKNQQRMPAGTLMIPLGLQKEKREAIRELLSQAARKGVRIVPVSTGITPQGMDLGSNRMRPVDAPKLAMIIGRGISNYEAGEVWHALDHRLKMPVSLIPLNRLSRTDLDRYDRLVAVSGSYGSATEKILQWVEEGGTLIAIGRAAATFDSQLRDSQERQSEDSNPSGNRGTGPHPKTVCQSQERSSIATDLRLHPAGSSGSDASAGVWTDHVENSQSSATTRHPFFPRQTPTRTHWFMIRTRLC